MGRQRSSRSVIPNMPVRRNGWPKVVAGQGRSPLFRGGPVFSEPVHARANLFRWRRYQTRSGVMHWKRKTKTAKWSYRTSELGSTAKSLRVDCLATDVGIPSRSWTPKLSSGQGQNCQSDKQRANRKRGDVHSYGIMLPRRRSGRVLSAWRRKSFRSVSMVFVLSPVVPCCCRRKNAPHDNCSVVGRSR